jgi:hypothetical protein
MTVYVDDASIAATVGPHTARWSHLFADGQAELHAFADQIGLRREWFQQGSPCGDGSPAPHWHYDVTTGKRRQALAFGARPVAWRDAPRMRERDARVAEAVPAAGVQPTGQEPEHLHAWQDSGRLQKTCHGFETAASRERGESGAWVTAYRPTLRATTAQRLRAAGIGAEDAGLQQVVNHNAAIAAAAQSRLREAGREAEAG